MQILIMSFKVRRLSWRLLRLLAGSAFFDRSVSRHTQKFHNEPEVREKNGEPGTKMQRTRRGRVHIMTPCESRGENDTGKDEPLCSGSNRSECNPVTVSLSEKPLRNYRHHGFRFFKATIQGRRFALFRSLP